MRQLKNNIMYRQLLKKLQKDTSEPCISLILPTQSINENRKDALRLKNLIASVDEKLNALEYDARLRQSLIARLNRLARDIDLLRTQKGIGLYVSENTSEFVHFPFEVNERAVVNHRFVTRELIYTLNRLIEYNLLVVSENSVRLFYGDSNTLQEIKNKDFPKHFEDQYEYSRSSPGHPLSSSLKGEAEKSTVRKDRFRQFLREVDQDLDPYLPDNRPLVVAGVKFRVTEYEALTNYRQQIIGHLYGNFDHASAHDLQEAAWNQISGNKTFKEHELLRTLDETVGSGMIVWGIGEVWKAARSGKGATLVLERDYTQPGWIDNERQELRLSPYQTDEAIKTEDAVDMLIEEVVNKKGNVEFVDTGRINKYDRIALLLRYNDRF